jgi:hypothetical protein
LPPPITAGAVDAGLALADAALLAALLAAVVLAALVLAALVVELVVELVAAFVGAPPKGFVWEADVLVDDAPPPDVPAVAVGLLPQAASSATAALPTTPPRKDRREIRNCDTVVPLSHVCPHWPQARRVPARHTLPLHLVRRST